MPSKNIEYWTIKFEKNQERDAQSVAQLKEMGWTVHTVWECQLKKEVLEETVSSIRKQLDDNRSSYAEYMADRRKRREEWRLEMKRRKQEEYLFCEQHLHTTTNDN